MNETKWIVAVTIILTAMFMAVMGFAQDKLYDVIVVELYNGDTIKYPVDKRLRKVSRFTEYQGKTEQEIYYFNKDLN